MADVRIVEQVLAALDDGVPAQLEALRAVVPAAEAELQEALAAVQRYHEQVAAARERAGTTQSTDGTLPCGAVIGDYRIESVLGSGAMGVVYRAHQISLGRAVALKVLPRHLGTRDARFVERFRREAASASAIHHPHVAEVHGLVEAGGTLAFAMRLVEGPTLHAALLARARRHVAPVRATSAEHVRRCVLLVRALADALAVIHAHGLVHRDVKPGNVLLEGDAAEPLDRAPVLVDFGLVRTSGESDLTNPNTMLGTFAYASHESTLGQVVDARADVFSLGATLHDLLTVTMPDTRGPATAGLPDVRAINPAVDARLAAIVRMALQPDRGLRYEHGGALRDELDCWLRNEPIRALPASPFGRLRLSIRRDPVRAMRVGSLLSLAAVVLATLLLTVFGAWHATRLGRDAVGLERRGELVAAADSFVRLHENGIAPWLPWLSRERRRAADYREGGALRPVVEAIWRARSRRQEGDALAEMDALELAGDDICRALLGGVHAGARDALYAYLVREAGIDNPEHRRRVALDVWTNLLIVQEQLPEPNALPLRLHAIVRATLFAPELPRDPTTEAAAVAALGGMRDDHAFEDLVAVLERARTFKQAELARIGASHNLAWIARLNPERFVRLAPHLMERWAAAYGRALSLGLKPEAIADALAAWQDARRGRGLPDHLDLPAAMQQAVVSATSQGTDFPHFAASATTFVGSIWLQPGPVQALAPSREAPDPDLEASPSRIELLSSSGGDAARARIRGSLLAASWESGTLNDGEGKGQPPFLRFDRPGHSKLRVRSVVPAGARRLDVRLQHMIGARAPLRTQGSAHVRLRILGIAPDREPVPLPWQYSTLAQIPIRGNDPNRWAGATVQMPAIGDFEQIEVLLEYVRGDTTYRLLDFELVWQLPGK